MQTVKFVPDSQVARLYGQSEATENFLCNYGFNAAFEQNFRGSDLQFVGYDQDGELRAVELPGHRFYMATLYLPQMRSAPGAPHPLISAYLRAAYGE